MAGSLRSELDWAGLAAGAGDCAREAGAKQSADRLESRTKLQKNVILPSVFERECVSMSANLIEMEFAYFIRIRVQRTKPASRRRNQYAAGVARSLNVDIVT